MMYKYIGCEALLNALKEERKNGNFVFTSKWIKEIIDHLPSADVVPKSEVEKALLDVEVMGAELSRYTENLMQMREQDKRNIAREIFEEIEKIRAKEIHKCEILRVQENEASERKYWEGGEHSLRQLSYWIAELKKKYIGESDVKRDTV